jgi:hypothetical protein
MTWKKYLTAIAATIGIVLTVGALAQIASSVSTAPIQPSSSYVSSHVNPGISNQPIPSTPSQSYISSQSTPSTRFYPQSATSSSASVATQPHAMTPAEIEDEVRELVQYQINDTPQIRNEIRKGIMRREATRSQSGTKGWFGFPGAYGAEIPKDSKRNVKENLKEIQNERSLLIDNLIELDELYQRLDVTKSEALALCNIKGLQVNQCQLDLGTIQPSPTSGVSDYAIAWAKWLAEKAIGEPPAHMKRIIELREKIGKKLNMVDGIIKSLQGKTETKNKNMRIHQFNLILDRVRHDRQYQYIFDDNTNRDIFENQLYESLELNDATLDSTIERINGSLERLGVEHQNEWRIKLKALRCVKEANKDNNFQKRVEILENHILKDIVSDNLKEGKYSDKIIDQIEDDTDVDEMIKNAYITNYRIEKRNVDVVNSIITKKEEKIKRQEDLLAGMNETDERYEAAQTKLKTDKVGLENWKHTNLHVANEKKASAYIKMIDRYPELQKKPGPEPRQGPEPEQLPGPGNSARNGSSFPIPNAGTTLAAAGVVTAAALGLASKKEHNNNVKIERREANTRQRIDELRGSVTRNLERLYAAEAKMRNMDPCNKREKETAPQYARLVTNINNSIVEDISKLRVYINDPFTITSEKSRYASYRRFQQIFNQFMRQSCGSATASATASATDESEYESEYESESESESERCLQKYRERYDLLHDTTLNDNVKFKKLRELNFEIEKLNCRNIIRNELMPPLVFSDILYQKSLGKQEALSSSSSSFPSSASSSSSSSFPSSASSSSSSSFPSSASSSSSSSFPSNASSSSSSSNKWPTPNALKGVINKSKSVTSNSSFTTPQPTSNLPTKTSRNPLNNMFNSVTAAARQSKKGGRYMTRKYKSHHRSTRRHR